VSGPARRAAVLGSPIAHSLSPTLHREAYRVLGLTGWRYDAFDVAEDGLAGFLDRLDESWAGLSLTMPLKTRVLGLVDTVSPLAAAVGAANTVLLDPGGRRAENTDVPGLAAALRGRGVERVERAAVLGGGATARSAVAALAQVADTVTAYVRTPERAEALRRTADAVGARLTVARWETAATALLADLVIATTSAGATDSLVARVPDLPGALFEVLYEPWPTPLAAAWARRGGVVVDGLDLLVHQAVLQVALLTGATVDVRRLVPRLRRAGEAALAAR
jgi:shikimate dehydrogenase